MRNKSFLLVFFIIVVSAAVFMLGSAYAFAADSITPDSRTEIVSCVEILDNGCELENYQNNDTPDIRLADAKKSSKKKTHDAFSLIKAIAIGFLVSTIGTAITVYAIFNSYKHNGKTEPYPYNKKAPLELTDSNDILINTDISRVRRAKPIN